jgi:hypothetical protein
MIDRSELVDYLNDLNIPSDYHDDLIGKTLDWGLNPRQGDIHFLRSKAGYDQATKKEIIAYSAYVSINGARKLAERTGKLAGFTTPMYCGKDGIWRELWLAEYGYPVAAKAGVHVKGFVEPVYEIALWSEYAKEPVNGKSNNWTKYSTTMINKCALMKAYRKAFSEFAGVYDKDELPSLTTQDDPLEKEDKKTEVKPEPRQSKTKPSEIKDSGDGLYVSEWDIQEIKSLAKEKGISKDNFMLLLSPFCGDIQTGKINPKLILKEHKQEIVWLIEKYFDDKKPQEIAAEILNGKEIEEAKIENEPNNEVK